MLLTRCLSFNHRDSAPDLGPAWISPRREVLCISTSFSHESSKAMPWLYKRKTKIRECLLTRTAGDVDINADIRYATSFQRRHTRVCPKVREFQVNDVQVGGARRHIGVSLCDDHPFGASQGASVFEPAERQLFRRDGFHLAGDFHLSPNLDIVVFMVRVRGDPKTSFF